MSDRDCIATRTISASGQSWRSSAEPIEGTNSRKRGPNAEPVSRRLPRDSSGGGVAASGVPIRRPEVRSRTLCVVPTRDHGLLAQVRRSLRALNGAIEAGSKAAGLTVQQQGFLLSLAARGGRDVPLAELRADLSMDQATASELLARLARRGLVRRKTDSDRRALRVSLTSGGRLRFRRSVRSIRREIRAADARGELRAMRQSLRAYLAFYVE